MFSRSEDLSLGSGGYDEVLNRGLISTVRKLLLRGLRDHMDLTESSDGEAFEISSLKGHSRCVGRSGIAAYVNRGRRHGGYARLGRGGCSFTTNIGFGLTPLPGPSLYPTLRLFPSSAVKHYFYHSVDLERGDMQSELVELVTVMFHGDTSRIESLLSIPYMPIKQRKALITLCRSQVFPHPKTRVRQRLLNDLRHPFDIRIRNTSYKTSSSLLRIIDPLETLITSPYLSGFLSMLVRNARFIDKDEVIAELNKGIEKEIRAAMEVYRPTRLNWESLLSAYRPDRRNQSLGKDYGRPIHMHDYIFSRLWSARDALSGKVLYPQIGRKTMGEAAAKEMRRLLVIHQVEMPETGTLVDCERFYHKTGLELTGSTEMRWSWKYNDLKPRVYYARGPDVYYRSRFVQPIFNHILEFLPQVSKRGRHDITSLRLAKTSRFFIYDYESFTSVLEEIKNFLFALADFMDGIEVVIVDTFFGPIAVKVKEVLDEYNETCNFFPTFDVSKANMARESEGDTVDLITHTCGMLGVPGNISSCTLLHGLHLLVVLESEECKVVGDDAAGDDTDDPLTTTRLLRNIGKLSETKVEAWYDEELDMYRDEDFLADSDRTWNYVKRPITRIANRVVTGFQAIWPPFCLQFSLDDGFHTSSTLTDMDSQRSRALRMIQSFVIALRRYPIAPTEEEVTLMDSWMWFCRRMITKKFTRDKILDSKILPSSVVLSKDLDRWIDEIEDNILVLSEVYEGGFLEVVKSEDLVLPMTRSIKLAEDLGYAKTSQRMQRLRVGSNRTRVIQWMIKDFSQRSMYNVVLNEAIPDWLMLLIVSDVNRVSGADSNIHGNDNMSLIDSIDEEVDVV